MLDFQMGVFCDGARFPSADNLYPCFEHLLEASTWTFAYPEV
jgi:hypothetical protein